MEKKETLEEAALRQLFKNKSNCYADTGRFENDGSYSEGEVIQAMGEDCFINTIKEWQQKRMYSEEEVLEIIKLSCEEGMFIQRTINDKVNIPYTRIKDFTIKMFEQFKKK